ncbi:hypothetical protein K402DRAFT_391385 [Aulographum hederae CBS 113979]|uniref:Tyrosinase copper-binding domain-containing protein n=1 Tax=Aulographum hederae CBS 113979 TaxID=1176131 RepID=A0A6G1H847_9PEZI|nr:hypothetical protein K402DRAFT_391385 [Aulographum hederae CBS 113979]
MPLDSSLCRCRIHHKFITHSRSRYDYIIDAHQNATRSSLKNIHRSGVLLRWHRYHAWEYENATVKEYNYTGTQPYRDSTIKMETAGGQRQARPIHNPSNGFGGNCAYPEPVGQSSGGKCIEDGPLKDMTLVLGTGDGVEDPGNASYQRFQT